MTYKEEIIIALKNLGGHAYLEDIYSQYLKITTKSIPKSFKAIIRANIERNSSDSDVYEGKNDVFYSVDGKGNGHWGIRNYFDENNPELTQDDDSFAEGKLLIKKHLYHERNPHLIKKAKEKFKMEHDGKLFCEVCGFDFKEKYGNLGEDFIEAHHTKPISEMVDGEKTNINDIVMVCSNCHSMLHRKKPWLKKEDIKDIIKK